MKIKEKVSCYIQTHPWIMKMYVQKYNHTCGEKPAFQLSGIKIRNNHTTISGQDNKLSNGKECSIQNNSILIDGQNNEICINDGVELNGTIRPTIFIRGNNNKVMINKHCKITDTSFFICGDNNKIILSDNVSCMSVDFHIEQNQNSIFIGRDTSMHGRGNRNIQFALDEGTTIRIDEDCMISNDVQIRSSDSHSVVSLDGKRLNIAQNVEIGKHCWIGLRSMILKGTKIPDNTVIAAGSICTKVFIEENTILAGSPANIVKHQVNWDRRFL